MKIETIAKTLLSWALGFLAAIFIFVLWAYSAQAQDGEWLPRRWKKGGVYYHHSRRDQPIRRSYYRGIEEIILQEETKQRCLGRIFTDKGRELSTEESAL